MGRHHRTDDEDTHILAEIVPLDEEPTVVTRGGTKHEPAWPLDGYERMFHGFDIETPELPERRFWTGPAITAALGVILALVAFTLALWVWLHTGQCTTSLW